jgi:hypothetical protein
VFSLVYVFRFLISKNTIPPNKAKLCSFFYTHVVVFHRLKFCSIIIVMNYSPD